jgi:hypothetical protein
VNQEAATASTENEQKDLETVRIYMRCSMGAAVIPQLLVDLSAVSAVQLKMVAPGLNSQEMAPRKNI